MGVYLSQDPIGLRGNNPNFYAYAKDLNVQIDPWGVYNGEGVRGLGKYNSFHDHQLDPSEYTKSDDYHFAKANESLHHKMQKHPEYAAKMEKKYPGIGEHVSPGKQGAFSTDPPPGTTWHHADEPGKLQLVDRADHRKYHKIHHPDGTGGRNKWGGGTKCR